MTEPRFHVPSTVGRAALEELPQVEWGDLEHAYGVGKVGDTAGYDVEEALRSLGYDRPDAVGVAVHALSSNVFHQGTIYPATAYAVPFVIAFAAGPEVARSDVRELVALVADIAVASSWETDDGSFAGSFGEDVGEDTRAAILARAERLEAIARRVPELAEIIEAVVALTRADPPRAGQVRRVVELLEELPEVEDEERTTSATSGLAEPAQCFRHVKFGLGRLVRREAAGLRLRFEDGSERVIVERFLEAVDAGA